MAGPMLSRPEDPIPYRFFVPFFLVMLGIELWKSARRLRP